VLDGLAERGFIEKYEVDGEVYGWIPTFTLHQAINTREAQSTLPEPPNMCTHVHARAMQVHAQGEGKGREGKGKEGKEINASVDACAVFDCWRETMDKPRAVLDRKRVALIENALALGYSTDDLCKAVRGCSKSPFHMGMNDRRTRYDSLELILRNAEKIDDFMTKDGLPPPGSLPAPTTIHDERRNTIDRLTRGGDYDALDA
jgi:hypothetical protein